MNNKQKYNSLNLILLFCSIFILIILSNIAIPIIYSFIMTIIKILTPFIISFFLAFLLHTLVDKVEAQGINRMLSVLLVFLTFIIIIAYLISSLIPIIFRQIDELEKQIPQIYLYFEEVIKNLWVKLDFVPIEFRFHMDDIKDWTMKNLFNFKLDGKKINSLFDSFNIIFLTPIITYYFLYDYNNIKNKIKQYLLKKNYKISYKLLKEIDTDIGAYFRGLILVMNLMTVFSALGFYLVGVEYPLLFGFIVGYTNIIPIIGPYIGGIPVIIFCLTKSFKHALLALLVVVIIQAIESNIVTPYIQSKSIDSHPLLILLAFIVFGNLFSVVGMIFAIPLLAVITTLYKYYKIYLKLKKLKKAKLLVANN